MSWCNLARTGGLSFAKSYLMACPVVIPLNDGGQDESVNLEEGGLTTIVIQKKRICSH